MNDPISSMLTDISAHCTRLRFTPEDHLTLEVFADQLTAVHRMAVTVDVHLCEEHEESACFLDDADEILFTVIVVDGGYELMDARGRDVPSGFACALGDLLQALPPQLIHR